MPQKVHSIFDINPITLVEDMVLEILETVDDQVDSFMGKVPVGHPLTEKEKALMAGDMDQSEALRIGEQHGSTGIQQTIAERSKAWLKQHPDKSGLNSKRV